MGSGRFEAEGWRIRKGGARFFASVARNPDGSAVHLGERITTEGIVTVDAATFANSKLKVFVQDGGAGIMVYHQTSAAVDAFRKGQRLRVTGTIGQVCSAYPAPAKKWNNGICNFATHVKVEIKVDDAKVNPLMASKKASGGSKKK